MTTTVIRNVPSALPHARIFLDDLFEIESIFTAEFSKLADPLSVSFEYVIDSNLVMTTHDELKEHGGYSTNFSLNIVMNKESYFGSGTLIFHTSINPRLELPFVLRDSAWAIFGKVEKVLKAREDRFKVLFESLPDSVPFWATGIVLTVGLVAAGILRSYGPRISTVIWTASGLFTAYSIVQVISLTRKNRVYFQHVRQDQKTRAAIRKERVEKLIWLLAGLVGGMIVTLLTQRLKH